MAELEGALSQLLSNPQVMGQIQALAKSLENAPPQQAPPPSEPDAAALAKFASLVKKSGVDSQQRSLLAALHPYLSPGRIAKLEKAMRASQLAELASGFLDSGGLSSLLGR